MGDRRRYPTEISVLQRLPAFATMLSCKAFILKPPLLTTLPVVSIPTRFWLLAKL